MSALRRKPVGKSVQMYVHVKTLSDACIAICKITILALTFVDVADALELSE